MKSKHNFIKWLFAAGTAVLISPVVQAQFIYTNNDLLLGFRKTGIHTESFEAAVNIGQATNYVYLQPGTTLPVPGFTASQLTPDSFSDLNFLSWSVSGFVKTNTLFVLPGYNNNTIWDDFLRSYLSGTIAQGRGGIARGRGGIARGGSPIAGGVVPLKVLLPVVRR